MRACVRACVRACMCACECVSVRERVLQHYLCADFIFTSRILYNPVPDTFELAKSRDSYNNNASNNDSECISMNPKNPSMIDPYEAQSGVQVKGK